MDKPLFKYENAIWSLPLLFQYEVVWGTYAKMLKIFDFEVPKVNLFGCPSCAWSGGRAPIVSGTIPPEILGNLFEYLKPLNATPTYTFTNSSLTKEDLKDEYCNQILDISAQAGARFIVTSEILKDYIKEKYPNACIIASVIKPALEFQGPGKKQKPNPENETEFYNNLLKEYDIVVVRPEYSMTVMQENANWLIDPSRVEVLINQVCIPECPKMPDHYRYLEETHKWSKEHPGEKRERFNCARMNLRGRKSYETIVAHTEDMVHKLVNQGVRHLKLQGRSTGASIEAIQFMLLTQMFNTDGKNYNFIGAMADGYINKEHQYFLHHINR